MSLGLARVLSSVNVCLKSLLAPSVIAIELELDVKLVTVGRCAPVHTLSADKVANVAPSTAITPADTLVIVVSVAAPTLTAVNCGESPVPTPRAVAAAAAVLAPVPPCATAISVAAHTPVAIVPTLVSEEATTAPPSVVALRTLVPLIS